MTGHKRRSNPMTVTDVRSSAGAGLAEDWIAGTWTIDPAHTTVKLTIRDVTRPVDLEFGIDPTGLMGEQRIGFSARGPATEPTLITTPVTAPASERT
jgi:polyisoprenoid-binding protein YceI